MTMRAFTTAIITATMLALGGGAAQSATAAPASAAANDKAQAQTQAKAQAQGKNAGVEAGAEAVSKAEAEAKTTTAPTQITDTGIALNAGETIQDIPCPSSWQVRPNPSVENSLSYVHDSGKMAISVTYISEQTGSEISSETFARVAAEQMNCTLPIASNLLEHAWSFSCEDGIEALIYGEPRNLVLLSISGRNEETETYLDKFISFLSYQAGANRRR